MEQLSEKVYSFTLDSIGFRPPCTVLIGVSGGADSMCLLHMVCGWKEKGVQPIAVHIQHGIRGDEAQRDAAFVREQCHRLQVPLYLVTADVPAIASAERCGLEEAGRLVRYAVYDRIMEMVGAVYVLTAHTASDQAETVMLNILRGCGVAGLTGIPACRGGVIRPLLQCTRTQVEEYCAAHEVPYVTDSTNEDVRYTRNAVRHEILPLLRSVNSSSEAALLRLSRTAARDESYMQEVASAALAAARQSAGCYAREAFLSQHDSIRYRMLRSALEEFGCRSMEERHFISLIRMIDEGRGRLELPGGFAVTVSPQRVTVTEKMVRLKLSTSLTVEMLPFRCHFGCYSLHLFHCLRNEYEELEKVHKMFFKYTIDYDTIQGSLQVRGRMTGDYIHPAGRGVGKSLKSLMNEWKIPAVQRDGIPVLCDDSGVVMIPGFCCDERARIQEHTKHFLVCFVEHLPT